MPAAYQSRQDTLIRQLQGKVRWGAGTPEGAVTAPVGTLYLQSDGGAGTTFYVKESGTGNTGWVTCCEEPAPAPAPEGAFAFFNG